MVLVDTSVLVNFFKGVSNEKEKMFEDILKKRIPLEFLKYSGS
jgi:predicted nucleic acid-binding protein